MKIIKEKNYYDPNDIVLIEPLTYYKLEFLINDWILRIFYVYKSQISLQESMTIMKEEINVSKSYDIKFKNKNILDGYYFRFK